MLWKTCQQKHFIILFFFRRLANLFHRTLAVLAIIDNVFIACDILESFRRFGPKSTNSTIVGSFCSTHIYATPYVLRPLCVTVQPACRVHRCLSGCKVNFWRVPIKPISTRLQPLS